MLKTLIMWGLLVGNPKEKVTNILIAHDALENVIEEAITKNCNFIICFSSYYIFQA